ncbi:MAG: DUF1302 family protein [Fidelibacterota bacterium]
MKSKLLLGILLSWSLITAQVDIGGYVKNYNAVRLNNDHDYLVLRNRFRLNFNYPPSEYAFGYASLDVKNDHLSDHNDLELNLREMYLDLYFDNLDLRIGKQQIVWGEADGLFITDIVNPLDLREFILADFEDIRMAVNSIKAQAYLGDSRLEAVWIPQFVPAKFSSTGEAWAFYTMIDEVSLLIPDSLIAINAVIFPERQLRNSEYGWRFSTLVRGVDLKLSYFRTWDDYPIFLQDYELTQLTQAPLRVTITPEYGRLTVWGGTFSSTLGSLIIRGESALYQKRNLYTSSSTDEDRVVKKDFLNYMIGAEMTPGEASISGQFVQEVILDYDTELISDEINTMGTLFLSQTFWNETVKPEMFVIYNFTKEDYLSQFRVKFYPLDGVEFILNVDLLGGKKENTLFSQFDDNDNIYLKIKYSF